MPSHEEPEAADEAMTKGGRDSLVVVMVVDAAAVWKHRSQRQHSATTI